VLRHRFSWKRLSMAGALAYRPGRGEAALVFQIREGAYDTASLIEFLAALHEHFREKVTVIWDGLPSHRSRAMKTWIRSQRSWLVVKQLPGYAHDLNPIEQVWGNVKAVELRGGSHRFVIFLVVDDVKPLMGGMPGRAGLRMNGYDTTCIPQ
jgi:hypothetical protein